MKMTIKLTGMGILLVLGSMFSSSALAANSVTVNFKGKLILNPPCDISGVNNGPIEIDFGDVVIRNVTSNYLEYRKPIPYTLTCDASETTRVALTFKGTGTTYDSGALGSNNPNFGIRFSHDVASVNTRILLNQAFPFTNNERPTLYAYPAINNAVPVTSIAAGTFTASATLEASYP